MHILTLYNSEENGTITLQCSVVSCAYVTQNSSEKVACTLLAAYPTIHMRGTNATLRGPKLERPKVDVGLSLEEWNIVKHRWDGFVQGSALDSVLCSTQLFQCAGQTLGDSLLKSDPTIVSKPTADLLAAMKRLAVIAVAKGVTRAELMSINKTAMIISDPFQLEYVIKLRHATIQRSALVQEL